MSSLAGKISIGAALSNIFRGYGRNWVLLTVLTIVLVVSSAVISIVPTIDIFLQNPSFESYLRASLVAQSEYGVLTMVLTIAYYLVMIYVQAFIVLVVYGSFTGPRDRLGIYLAATNRAFLPAVGLFLIAALVFLALGLVLFLITGAADFNFVSILMRLGVTEIILLYIALIALMLYVFAVFIAVFPTLVIERPGVFRSIGRGVSLTKGNRWRLVAIFLILFVAFFIVLALLGAIGAGLGSSGSGAGIVISLIIIAVSYVMGIGLSLVVPPALYHQLRLAKEGPTADQVGGVFD